MNRDVKRWSLTSQVCCGQCPGAVLSALCRNELHCCCVWGSWWSGWSRRRCDGPHRSSTGSYRIWGRAESKTPHSPGSLPTIQHTNIRIFVILYNALSLKDGYLAIKKLPALIFFMNDLSLLSHKICGKTRVSAINRYRPQVPERKTNFSNFSSTAQCKHNK